MKNIKLIRFAGSFILLPVTTISAVPVGPITQAAINIVSAPQTVLSQKLNNADDAFASNNSGDSKVTELEAKLKKAESIDAYFRSRSMPLHGLGMKMVEEAEKNNLDWRILAAIAVRESTGGKFACKKATHNPFGWGSCKINFKSNHEAIETVARNLGGNNPRTAKHYANKNVTQILRAYNPPSIIPRYAEQVIAIMNAIGTTEVTATVKTNT